MKKLLSLLLILAICLSIIPAVYVSAEEKEENENYLGVTEIMNFSQLKSALSSKKENWKYILVDDINCNGQTLGKILHLGAGCVLDGDGYSILNFKTGSDDASGRSGIFSLATTGTITFRNLTFGSAEQPIRLSNCLVNRNPGAASGDPEKTVWENVTAYVDLTRTDGGYLGVFYGSTTGSHHFIDCDVTVTASSKNSYIGGYIGRFYGPSLTFENCSVNGELQCLASTNEGPAGGFIGSLGNSSTEDIDYSVSLSMSNCVNNAKITATVASTEYRSGAGGFIGLIKDGGRTMDIEATLTRCVNNGEISGNVAAGGFLGYVNTFNPKVYVVSCINNGDISGKNATASQAGGFIGRWLSVYGAYFERCINYGEISQSRYLGGFVGVAERGLMSFDTCYNAGTIIATSGSHMGGFTGRVVESARFQNCVNVGKLTRSDNSAIGNVGQFASKVEGFLRIDNCYGLGEMDCTATNCGALVGVIPTDFAYSNNKYLYSGRFNKYYGVDITEDCLETQEEAERILEDWLITGDDEESVFSAPVLRGVQETTPVNGAHNIRLVAVIDTKNYQSGGFTVTLKTASKTYSQNKDMYCAYMYEAIRGIENGESVVYKADGTLLAGKYVMPLSLSVPTNEGFAEILATPYMIDKNGVRHEGETVCITYHYTDDGSAIQSVDFNQDEADILWEDVFSGVFPPYQGGIAGENTYSHSLTIGETKTDPSKYKMIAVSNTDMAAFESYVQGLKDSGFDVADAGDAIEGVSGYWVEKDSVRVYMYFVSGTGIARFILDTDESQHTLAEVCDTYQKQAGDTVTFYQYGLRMSGPSGGEGSSMFLVAKLADNSVVLIDGGTAEQMSEEAGDHLNEFLHEITGTPTGQKVTIRAWVFTHHHVDHTRGVIRFLVNYHDQYDLKTVMYNMADARDYLVTFFSNQYIYKYYPDLKLHRLHTGETLKLGGVEIDIMYTLEDLIYPDAGTIASNDDNDFSIIYRFRFDGIKLMVTGDFSVAGEKVLMKMYERVALKVDVLQIPHHGYNSTYKLFSAANPKISLLPNDYEFLVESTDKWSNIYQSVVSNTVGGAENCFFGGEETVGIAVVNGVVTDVFHEQIYGTAYNGWGDFDLFPSKK